MKTSFSTIKLIFLSIFLLFNGCTINEDHKSVVGELIQLDSINAPNIDLKIDSVISIYRTALEDEMNQVIAHSAVAMRRDSPEGLLNNFVADLVFEIGRELYQPADDHPIDFCLLNYGGLRTSIPQGPVTRSRVFELMPFENEMLVVTLSAESTRELFEYLARSKVGMPVAGITLGIKDSEIEKVSIQGEPFDNNRKYKVLTSDYLAGGGDNMIFFLNPLNTEILDMKIRDAIILHMKRKNKRGEQITSRLDNRIYIAD